MIGKITGVLILIFFILFVLGSCKAVSWADREMEEELRRREQDEKKDI